MFLHSKEKTYPSLDKANVLLIEAPHETFEICQSIKAIRNICLKKIYGYRKIRIS